MAPTEPPRSSVSCGAPVDLLVVGSHGHGPLRDLLLGQTVDKVRHGLDIPMLIARPEPTPTIAEPIDTAVSCEGSPR